MEGEGYRNGRKSPEYVTFGDRVGLERKVKVTGMEGKPPNM